MHFRRISSRDLRLKSAPGGRKCLLAGPPNPARFLIGRAVQSTVRPSKKGISQKVSGVPAVRVAHFDCFSGISGDMTLAALLDAGVDANAIRSGLDSLGLPIQLEVE